MPETLQTFLVKIVHVIDQGGKKAVLDSIADVTKAVRGLSGEEAKQARQSKELSRGKIGEAEGQAAEIARAFDTHFRRFAMGASRYVGTVVAAFASVRAFKNVIS